MSQTRQLLAKLRKEYSEQPLLESSLHTDPLRQFKLWFTEAVKAKIREPHAFCLATSEKLSGQPSARMVLMKHYDRTGFVFVSNYESRKAREISASNKVAAVFYWCDLERQVRIEGKVKKLSSGNSDKYFALRPRGSQLAALMMAQSTEIESRETLELSYQQLVERYQSRKPKRPNNWGGYLIIPERIEFWQGRRNRLHDRIVFSRNRAGRWEVQRLAP